jgi:aminoglycoside phosphotransferase (APT) family kinase protein
VIRDPEVVGMRLAPWLQSCIPGADAIDVVTLTIPKQGFSNETWFVDVDVHHSGGRVRHELVLRVQPESSRLFLDPDVMLQWHMMAALSAEGIPTPPLVAADPEGTVVGSPMFVMDKVPGRIPPDLPPYNVIGWMTELSPAQRATVWHNGLAAMAAIHSVPWERACSSLDQPARGAAGLDQYLNWVEEWHAVASAERDVPLLAAAVAHLRDSAPSAPPISVVWGDARPGNIIYDNDLEVAAVLDWEMAALGPGEIDLAWWLVMDRVYSEGFECERLDGLPTRDRSIRAYEQLAGRGVADLAYYDLLAAARMALVVSRSTAGHVRAGRLDPATTMDSANPAMRIVAELMGVEVPLLSADFTAIIRAMTRR